MYEITGAIQQETRSIGPGAFSIAVQAMTSHEDVSEALAVFEETVARKMAVLILVVLLQAVAILYLVCQARTRKPNVLVAKEP